MYNLDTLLKQCRTPEERAGLEQMITMALNLRWQIRLRTSYDSETKKK